MTYKYDLYQGFENDQTGTLSESLVSAWSLTELAGPRRDSASGLAVKVTSGFALGRILADPVDGLALAVIGAVNL